MNPKMWHDLKRDLDTLPLEDKARRFVRDKMVELELRELPNRVAEILKDIDINAKWCAPMKFESSPAITWCRYRIFQDVWDTIIHALETGDTSTIETWRESQ